MVSSSEPGRSVCGSDVNCRALVEDMVKNKRLINHSKVTKEDIIVHFSKLVAALAEDPVSLWSTLARIAPPRTPADVRLGRGYDGDYSNSPGEGPNQLRLPEKSNLASAETTEQPTGEEVVQPEAPAAAPAWRPVADRVCASVLERRGPCRDGTCNLEHPADCQDVACHGRRLPQCKNWHLTQHKWSVWSAELERRRAERDEARAEKHRARERDELIRLRQEKKDWKEGKFKSKSNPRHWEKKAAPPGTTAAPTSNKGGTRPKTMPKWAQQGLQQVGPPPHQLQQQHFPAPPPPPLNAWSAGSPFAVPAQTMFTPAQIKALTELIRAVVQS